MVGGSPPGCPISPQWRGHRHVDSQLSTVPQYSNLPPPLPTSNCPERWKLPSPYPVQRHWWRLVLLPHSKPERRAHSNGNPLQPNTPASTHAARAEITTELCVIQCKPHLISDEPLLQLPGLLVVATRPSVDWALDLPGTLERPSTTRPKNHVKTRFHQATCTSHDGEKWWRDSLLEMVDHHVCDGKVALFHWNVHRRHPDRPTRRGHVMYANMISSSTELGLPREICAAPKRKGINGSPCSPPSPWWISWVTPFRLPTNKWKDFHRNNGRKGQTGRRPPCAVNPPTKGS